MKARSLPFPAVLVPLLLLPLYTFCRPGVSFAGHTKAETTPPPQSEGEAANPSDRAERADAAEADTPKGALRAYDVALPAGGLEAATAAYHAENDKERQVAWALAEVDLATSQLQEKVKEKFGPAAVEVVLHAARNATRKDLEEAGEKIDGDRAVITWKTKRPSVPMVKVDGKWRVSTAGVINDLGKGMDVDQIEKTCGEVAKQLRRTSRELAAGEYVNVNLLERAVQQRMYKVLGEEE